MLLRLRPLGSFSKCNKSLPCIHVIRADSILGSGARNLNTSTLPKPRLNYRDIAENVVYKSHNALNRKSAIPVGAVQSVGRLYAEQKDVASMLDIKRHDRAAIGERVRTAKSASEKAIVMEDARILKQDIAELESELGKIEDQLLLLALSIPNDSHPSSPLGPEDAAVKLSIHGPELLPASPSRDHVDVGRTLGLFDFDAGSVVTGSSWYYLMNEAVFLEQALISYALSIAVKHGYTPVATPDVVRSDIAWRCGFHPREQQDGASSQSYHVSAHGFSPSDEHAHPQLLLAGTAEIPLAGMFANKIHPVESLPLKVVGVGKSFRAEAGAKGTDTRGLYRVHQFTKVELFAVTENDQSEEMFDELRQIQEEIFQGLGIPFRVLDMPTEELGASAYRKYDMEAWMPGRGTWGEISSTSNCTDYQSRRLHIRYQPHPSKPSETKGPLPFAHTLNGTAAAIPRLIVALIENGVRFDESGHAVGLNLPKSLKTFWIGAGSRSIVHWS